MKPPYQVPLAIDRPLTQALDNFIAGQNQELLALLATRPRRFTGIWVSGPAKSGRTHLLRGCALAQSQAGERMVYINGMADLATSLTSLEFAAAKSASVCVDDVSGLQGCAEAESLLMSVYQQVLQARGMFVVAHTRSSQQISFDLPDLNSRLRSLMHFDLAPLNDAEKAQLLKQRAKRRGYELNQAVIDYWLARAPRDTGTLLTDLEVLDRATLARKQTVTIPLLKRVLGY